MEKILIKKENPPRLMKIITSFNSMFTEIIIVEIVYDDFDLAY